MITVHLQFDKSAVCVAINLHIGVYACIITVRVHEISGRAEKNI